MNFLVFLFFQPESTASNTIHLSLSTFRLKSSHGGFHVVESTVQGGSCFLHGDYTP